jgi:hypothetical protein
MAEHVTRNDETQEDLTVQNEMLEEFSIFELDDRLEFVAWCDSNCVCTGTGTGSS